jgi:hypothetical protein
MNRREAIAGTVSLAAAAVTAAAKAPEAWPLRLSQPRFEAAAPST